MIFDRRLTPGAIKKLMRLIDHQTPFGNANVTFCHSFAEIDW
jgi:hypothetical protein